MPIIRDILVGASKGNLAEMCRELELDPSDLYRSEIQVPFEKAFRTWEIALKYSDDPLLGLHLGARTNPSIMGLVGHLMQSCPDLRTAFQSVCEFSTVATDMFRYTIEEEKGSTRLSFEPCEPWVRLSATGAAHAVDQAMAGTLSVFGILSGKKITPIQVDFARMRSRLALHYEELFQAPIRWGTAGNSLVFHSAQLATPLISYDESLMGMFQGLVRARLEQLQADTSIEDQIRREIMTTFMGQLPPIESMAARMNMTVRSLQRRLDEANISYRRLCSELGREFAVAMLQKKAKVSHVAAALGYSDSRAFQRAFKSWTGQTPREFRAS